MFRYKLGVAQNIIASSKYNTVCAMDIYQSAEDLQVEDIYDTFTICPMSEEEEMYEDIDAPRAAINVSSPPVAPPPVPAGLPPSKPPSRLLPEAPSIYNKYTPGFSGPNAKTTSADIYDTATDTSTSGAQGVKQTTPGYPGPRTAPATTPAPQPPPPSKPPSGVTANRQWPPPASNPAPTSLKEVEPPSAAPPTTTKQSSLPKWPPSTAKPEPPKPKAVDRPDDINKRRTNKPQPAADGKFYCGVCRAEIAGHQGTVLGPLLLLCFVNDIPDCVSSNIRLYADDILLYRTINVMDDCVKLQDDLNALQQWEKGGKCTSIHQNVVTSDYLTSNTSLIIIIIFIILFFK